MKCQSNFTNTLIDNFPKQFTIEVDSSQKGIDKLIKKENELKAECAKYKKANNLKTIENSCRDKEIEQLNDKIQKTIVNNYDLDMGINKEVEIRSALETEQTKIAHYCNDIKKKFKHSQKTIDNYEKKLVKMQIENDKLSEKYDFNLEEYERENKKLMSQLDEKIHVYNTQKTAIVGVEHKLNDIISEIEQQKKTFEERAVINKIKYSELEKKFNNLQKKIFNLQMNAEQKRKEKMNISSKVRVEQNEKEDIEKEIEEYNKKNKQLEEQINEINKQWRHVSSASNGSFYTNRTKKSRAGTERSSNISKNSFMN